MGLLQRRAKRLVDRLVTARAGIGPLLQRDYWALIDQSRESPSEVMSLVTRCFPTFAPEELVRFERVPWSEAPLEVGDRMRVLIKGAGEAWVRVLHRDKCSLTLGTIEGHPEAGRITFGAYPNDFGDVIFHIRSRARSGSRLHRAGFLALGEAMQTTCWVGFVNGVAAAVGDGVVGYVHAVTSRLPKDEDDALAGCTPTFIAEED